MGSEMCIRDSYNELRMQPYFSSQKITASKAKKIFMFRMRVAEVRENFRGKYSDQLCPFQDGELDEQEHLLVCATLSDGATVEGTVNYSDLFSENSELILPVINAILEVYNKRIKMLEVQQPPAKQ